MRGRPSKDPALKKLAGTYRKDRGIVADTVGALTEVPQPPAWLSGDAVQVFNETCGEIVARGVMHHQDINTVAIYSNELVLYRTAMKKLEEPDGHVMITANGYKQISPWVTIRNQAIKNLKEVGALLGMDPFNRNRLPKPPPIEEDPLEAIMREYDNN